MVEDSVSGEHTSQPNSRENRTLATEKGTNLGRATSGSQGWPSHLVREETHSRFQGDGGDGSSQ